MPPARTERAGSDCRAWRFCRGSYGPPVEIAWAASPSQAPKSRPFGEDVSSADRGHHGTRNDRPDARPPSSGADMPDLDGTSASISPEGHRMRLIQPGPVDLPTPRMTRNMRATSASVRVRKDGGQFRCAESRYLRRTAIPRSSMKARIWLMMPVRCAQPLAHPTAPVDPVRSAVLVATNFHRRALQRLRQSLRDH